jgi:hypothetical protein
MRVTNALGLVEAFSRITQRGQTVDQKRTGSRSDKSSSVRTVLASQMAKAKRNGGWFRLSRLERGLFSLALRINVRFESTALVRALVSVLEKLREVCSPVYEQLVKGTELAWVFAQAATKWGNSEAHKWMNDRGYALFLGRFLGGMGRRP